MATLRLLLALLLAGRVAPLQRALHYTYRYDAEIEFGIPDINARRGSLMHISADLNIWAPSGDQPLLIKMENAEFGQHSGDTCGSAEGCADAPGRRSLRHLQLGRHPFTYDLQNSFSFHEEESQGAANFYKAAALPFAIAPLCEGGARQLEEASYVQEDETTILGVCNGIYTQMHLYGTAAATHDGFMQDHVTADCQFGSDTSGCPALANTTYKVTRSIDLDHCRKLSFIQTHGEKGCEGGSSQCHNLLSRSSQGVYYIRGDGRGARLEAAEITGSVLVSPFGYRTEFVSSVTRQTLVLVAVAPYAASSAPALQTEVYKMSDAAYDLPVRKHDWETTFTAASPAEMMRNIEGFTLTEEMNSEIEMHLRGSFSRATAAIAGRSQGALKHVPAMLLDAKYNMLGMSGDQLENMARALYRDEEKLFHGVLATVGTPAAVTVLLSRLERMSQERQVVLWGSLMQSVVSPEAVDLLLDHVLNREMEKSKIATSQMLINTAKFLKRFCAPKHPSSPVPANACGEANYVKRIRDYLFSKLNHPEGKFWKQATTVKALVALRDARASNALLPWVLGRRPCDAAVRMVAMDALASWGAAAPDQRQKYVLTLFSLLENPAEAGPVRAAALGRLASWQLTGPEWGRLALLTRRPGNRDLQGLAYSLIRATAGYRSPDTLQQMQLAQHALALARPTSSTARLSSFHSWLRYLSSAQFGFLDHVAVIEDPMAPLPAHLALFTQQSYGGAVFQSKVEAMQSNYDGNLDEWAADVFVGADPKHRPKTWHDSMPHTKAWNNMERGLELTVKVRDAVRSLVAMATSTGLELLVPLDREFLWELEFKNVIFDFDRRVPPKTFTIYTEMAARSALMATDIGIPLMIAAQQPAVTSVTGKTPTFGLHSASRYKLTVIKSSIVHTQQHVFSVSATAPFARHAAGAGVTSGVAVTLPFEFNLRSANHFVVLEADIAMKAAGAKVTLVERHTQPWIFGKPSTRMKFEDLPRNFKPIFTSEMNHPIYQELRNFTHYATVEYSGDYRTPVPTWSDILDVLLPTKKSSYKVLEDSMKTCKSFSQKIILNLPPSDYAVLKVRFSKDQRDGTQGGAQSFDDYYDSREASSMEALSEDEASPQSKNPWFASSGIRALQVHRYLANLRKLPNWKNNITALSFRVEFLEWNMPKKTDTYFDALQIIKSSKNIEKFHGHVLEAIYARTTVEVQNDRRKIEEVMGINIDDSPTLQYCAVNEVIDPAIDDLDTWQTLLLKNMRKETLTKVYSGNSCDVYIGGSNDTRWMSREFKSSLAKEISNEAKNSIGRYDKIASFLQRAVYDRDQFTSEGFNELHSYPVVGAISVLYNKFLEIFWGTTFSDLLHGMSNPSIGYSRKSKRTGEKVWSIEQSLGGGPVKEHTVELEHGWLEHSSLVASYSEYHPEEYCVAGTNMIYTFDGLALNASLTPCPTLLATACDTAEEKVFGVSAWTGEDGGVEALIAAEHVGVVVHLAARGITVNYDKIDPMEPHKVFMYGDTTKNMYWNVGARFHQRDGSRKVEISEVGRFILKDGRLYVHIDPRYGGYICGLCGDRNRDPTNDMAGPQHCALSDAQELLTAWSPSVDAERLVQRYTPAGESQCPGATVAAKDCRNNTHWDPQHYTCHLLSLSADDGEPSDECDKLSHT